MTITLRSASYIVPILLMVVGLTDVHAAGWRKLHADGFTVVGDVSDRKLRAAAEDVAIFRTVIGRFVSTARQGEELPVSVFAVSGATWKKYLSPRQGVAGYFVPGAFQADIVIAADDDFEASRVTVYHEYTHFYIHNNDKFPYPVWFDEGLAQLMSTLYAARGTLYAGGLPPRGWLDTSKGRWIPLGQVLAATRESPEYIEHKAAPQFYGEALLLAHYLIIGAPPERRALLNKFMKHLVVDKLEPDAATRAAFGIPLPQLEQDLLGYYRQGQFLAMVMPDPRDRGSAGKWPIEGLSEREGLDAVGHLIFRARLGPARASLVFNDVLTAEPTDRRAMAGMALAHELQSQPAEADAWLQRVATTPSPRGLPDRYCGEIYAARSGAAGDQAQAEAFRDLARSCFNAARTADTEDVQSLVGLASLALADPAESERLIAPLREARARYPENAHVAYALAQSLWFVGQQREALEHLRRAIEATRDVEARRRMTEMYRKLGQSGP